MATPSPISVQEQIKAQGAIVRQLKKDQAPQEKVQRSCSHKLVSLPDCCIVGWERDLPSV